MTATNAEAAARHVASSVARRAAPPLVARGGGDAGGCRPGKERRHRQWSAQQKRPTSACRPQADRSSRGGGRERTRGLVLGLGGDGLGGVGGNGGGGEGGTGGRGGIGGSGILDVTLVALTDAAVAPAMFCCCAAFRTAVAFAIGVPAALSFAAVTAFVFDTVVTCGRRGQAGRERAAGWRASFVSESQGSHAARLRGTGHVLREQAHHHSRRRQRGAGHRGRQPGRAQGVRQAACTRNWGETQTGGASHGQPSSPGKQGNDDQVAPVVRDVCQPARGIDRGQSAKAHRPRSFRRRAPRRAARRCCW